MAALKRLVFVIVVVLERALVCVQSLVYDNLDFWSLGVSVVVVLDLENQCRFTFLEALEVESPATTSFDVEDGFVANAPAECMLVVLGGGNFFLVVVEELDGQMFAKAVCVDAERFEALVFFALVNAVGERPIGPVEVPAFGFEVFVLVGGSRVAVAAGDEYEGENGNSQKLNFLHYKSFICYYVVDNVYKCYLECMFCRSEA